MKSEMKKLLCFTAVCAALGALAPQAHAVLPIERWTAKSGARVVFVASPSIPMLDVRVDFDAGSRYDPEGKAGLANLTAGLLSAGVDAAPAGSAAAGKARSEGEMSDAFADIGAQFSASSGIDFASARLRTLSNPAMRAEALELMTQALQRPAFPANAFERDRQIAMSNVRENMTRPATVARVAFFHALYGRHPYGYSATEASLSAIRREDVAAFYRNAYAANRAVVSIVGAVTRQEAEALAEKLTAGLPAASAAAPAMPPVLPLKEGLEERIVHPSEQAHILVGQPAIARNDPDYFPLLVGNQVLGGGGFASRLTEQVREKRGLSYSVYSYFLPLQQPGIFEMGLQTRKDQADQALKVANQTVADFAAKGPTEAELRAAKDNLVKGFPLRIDGNAKLLDTVASIAWYGLPLDYLDTWGEKVERVTSADVRAAFARRVQPDRMVTVIVGASERQQ
ncbi:MAG: insulinase family protein [Candidatus Protistobacter heckmanni]|nr:insulinase family protein [Candidatus Protistobacter heckmanni]